MDIIIRKIYYKLMIRLYKLIHKDPMELKISLYRIRGANIGKNVRAFSPIQSSESYLISIGDNTTISVGVQFCTHDNSAIKFYEDATDYVGAIKIGNNCFVGMNALLMGGVVIADNCIIGAGSVVSKSVLESGSIVAGNPARTIGNISAIKERKFENRFDFRGKSFEEKKKIIMDNPDKWIRR